MFFSLFIANLGPLLNQTGCGVDIMGVNISCLLFADDLVLFGCSEENLQTLASLTRDFLAKHHLEISATKSKLMTFNSQTGKMNFNGHQNESNPYLLDLVLSFKYLGVHISTSSMGFFKSFNDSVVKKSRNYMQSVLSLVKNGPDRSDLAYSLWTRMALPAILYGTEVIPLTQFTLNEIERCQSSVGKFILQIPRNSTNVCANIDAGLQPIWSLVAERFISYASRVMLKPHSFWPKLAMEENISLGTKSPYTCMLLKYKTSSGSYGLPVSQIRKNLKHQAAGSTSTERRKFAASTYSMSLPSNGQKWFCKKPWVNDSPFSKIFAEFRSCNTGLGNRGPTRDGQSFKLCPLCTKESVALILLI